MENPLIKLGIDIGESKIGTAIWSSNNPEISLNSSRDQELFTPCVYLESLIKELKYDFSPGELSIRVGSEAWKTFTEVDSQKKLKEQRAWFIPSVKRLLSTQFSGSRFFLQEILAEMKKKLDFDLKSEVQTFVSIPLHADFFFREVVKDSFKNVGFNHTRLYDEPLCILSSSGVLDSQQPFTGKVVTVDYGAQNLVLASFTVNSIPGHIREVVLLDYQVEPGVGGEFIDDKILADICRQNRDLESEVNYFKNLGYLYLIREKREELAEKGELSSKWQMFDTHTFQYKLSLERLQDIGKELCSRALQSFQEFLNRDRNKNPDIIIFTGGMSSFPGVKNCLEGSIDLLKVKHVDSRGAIAQGALQLELNLDPELTYRKDFSIGVGLSFGKFFPLLDLSKLPQDEGKS